MVQPLLTRCHFISYRNPRFSLCGGAIVELIHLPIRSTQERIDIEGMCRRSFLQRSLGLGVGAFIAGCLPAMAQEGMSSRNLKGAPRKARSGKPYLSNFTDVALQAGLVKPVVYGEVDRKRVILETMGCGVAFIDYDRSEERPAGE